MTRDAQTWGTAAWARRVRDHALDRQSFPPCPNPACGPLHKWHGLMCQRGACECKTSFIDEGAA